MPVATKLPSLSHLLVAPSQPSKLTDLMATPLIDRYSIGDVTGSFPAAGYELNVYYSSAGCLQLLTSFHISHKSAFYALSRPRRIMRAFNAA